MRRLFGVAVLLLAASGCGGGDRESAAPAAPAPPPAATAPAATVPTADDPLAGLTLEGEPLTLDRFRGEYLFVNVWSSW